MNVNGIIGKIKDNADKLGAVAFLMSTEDGNKQLDNLLSSIQQLSAGVLHAPDVTLELQLFAQREGKSAILAYIAGEFLKEINIPKIGNIGKPLQNAAIGYAMTGLVVRMLYGATHSELVGTNILQGNYRPKTPIIGAYNY